MRTCRSCLSDTFDNINLFETLFEQRNDGSDQKEIEMSTIFHECTNIHLNENDIMPKYICLMCLEKLISVYEFILNCKQNDMKLREINDVGPVDIVQSLDSSNGAYSEHDSETSITDDSDNDMSQVTDEQLFNSSDDDGHKCLKCFKMFATSAKLKKHQRIHTGNWNCPECDRVLANKHSLRFHMILHTGKPHECAVCEKRFVSIYELRRHIKVYHKNGKSHVCDQCSKRYYTFNQLKNHKLTHSKPTDKEFKPKYEDVCDHEDKKMDEELIIVVDCVNVNASIHNEDMKIETRVDTIDAPLINPMIKTEHDSTTDSIIEMENDEQPFSDSANEMSSDSTDSKQEKTFYRCKSCFKKFRLKSNYLSHLKLKLNCKADLNTKTNPQKCEHCNTISDNLYQLRKHLELHLDKEPFKCPACGKVYKSWIKLAGHKRQVHSSKPVTRKPHLCTLCGKGFSSSKLLDDHYMVHQGVRNYKCDQCERSFCTIYGLKQHLTIHTRDALQCSECGKILANKMSLKNHMTIHFGKDYPCTMCDKRYPDTATLNRHLKVHRGERNYACDQCGKRYYRGGDLNDHIRKIHENPMDFKCEVCGSGFGHRRALKKHVRLVHIGKKIYKCESCGKTYDRKSRLKDHEKKCHTNATNNHILSPVITPRLVQSETAEIPVSNYSQITGLMAGLFQ